MLFLKVSFRYVEEKNQHKLLLRTTMKTNPPEGSMDFTSTSTIHSFLLKTANIGNSRGRGRVEGFCRLLTKAFGYILLIRERERAFHNIYEI